MVMLRSKTADINKDSVLFYSLSLEWIRVTRFLYANEAHNILMTGLGTHERFTIEMRTCVQHTPKKMSIL